MSSYRHTILLIALMMITSFASAKDFVVVIDPGHGGRDYGAIGTLTNEKTINLAVAKKLGKLITDGMSDAKVVFTRDDDTFITLNDRARIANRAKGDLFISIHVNSVDRRSRNRTTVAGAEVFTLGLHKSEENLEVAKRENAVMALEADYSETYRDFDPNSVESYIIFELNQSIHIDQSIDFASKALSELTTTGSRANKGVKQAGFWVLWSTSMPAVLVELDFICNPTSERFMASEDGQTKLAESLYNALQAYRAGTPVPSSQQTASHVVTSSEQQPPVEQSTATADNATTDRVEYRIQILADESQVPLNSRRFKGYSDISEYQDKGMYKYTVGHYPTFDAARRNLKAVRKNFPEAFIIKMKNGVRLYE